MPDGAALLTRFENLPVYTVALSRANVVGSATFFDGFDSLSLAFALPVLIRLWKITPAESGLLAVVERVVDCLVEQHGAAFGQCGLKRIFTEGVLQWRHIAIPERGLVYVLHG